MLKTSCIQRDFCVTWISLSNARRNLSEITKRPNSRSLNSNSPQLEQISNLLSYIWKYRHIVVSSTVFCLNLALPAHTMSITNCTVLRCIARRCKYNDERPTVLRKYVARSDAVGCLINLKINPSFDSSLRNYGCWTFFMDWYIIYTWRILTIVVKWEYSAYCSDKKKERINLFFFTSYIIYLNLISVWIYSKYMASALRGLNAPRTSDTVSVEY